MNMQSDFQQAADPPDYQNNQEIEDSAVWMRFLPQNSGASGLHSFCLGVFIILSKITFNHKKIRSKCRVLGMVQ
jgi:hypothetical protein